jgi:sodium/potassium-transporting ATPase subunit alpha
MDQKKTKNATDPASGIREIDVHLLPKDEVFARFSSSPTLGLEAAAVDRRSKLGKNIISAPPTVYWKKALNYVFGGFNFLMWIAFIVTIVRFSIFEDYRRTSSVRLALLSTTRRC